MRKFAHRRGAHRPGQWGWHARVKRSERAERAEQAYCGRASIRAETAATKGPRGPIKHPLDTTRTT